MTRFHNKTVLITGGTSGLGEDMVLRFAAEGARVIFTGRNHAKAKSVIDKVENNRERVRFVRQDVTQEADWQALVSMLELEDIGVDVLINNAGSFIVGPIESLSSTEFERLFELNVGSVFLGIKHLMPMMKARRTGVILTNASLSGLVGHEHCIAYCSSKAAAIQLSNVAALEGAPYGVRVLSLAPGPVWNKMLADTFGDTQETRDYFVDTQPYKKLCIPEHVTEAAMFLASDEARYITGTSLKVDCGRGAD
ncbi:SDR family oxidoreductase [Shewanella corallii]|uniref:SDR family oxidoreductase n=1 Tax=Shewanella corallii TaxID=560080 RepID=A0ABT0NAX3_9GAMM|nr:SDR family oxidoreductase [Shewanella corallii]MCL2915510.1 SDR family oxidoreductase [Shewanella corallii]